MENVPKYKAVDRKKDALRRLGIDLDELSKSPDISTTLKDSLGGLKAVLSALRFSREPSAQFFVEKYDSIPSRDREQVTWEAICIAAEVDPRTFLGVSLLAMREYSANRVKSIAISNHPEIIRKQVQYALLPGGDKDRAALNTALGFLPSPKGPTFIGTVKNVYGGPSSESEDSEDGNDDEREQDLDHLFPSTSVMQQKLQPIRQKLLEG